MKHTTKKMINITELMKTGPTSDQQNYIDPKTSNQTQLEQPIAKQAEYTHNQ
jgi:hypothetical protein